MLNGCIYYVNCFYGLNKIIYNKYSILPQCIKNLFAILFGNLCKKLVQNGYVCVLYYYGLNFNSIQIINWIPAILTEATDMYWICNIPVNMVCDTFPDCSVGTEHWNVILCCLTIKPIACYIMYDFISQISTFHWT